MRRITISVDDDIAGAFEAMVRVIIGDNL